MIRRIQSITVILLLLCGISLSYGQAVSAKLAQNYENETDSRVLVKEVLERLEKKFDVSFMYKTGLLDEAYVEHLSELSDNFGQAFNRVLALSDFSYRQLNKRTFIIYKEVKSANSLDSLKALEEVKGVVSDAESGKVLPGVNIKIKGTTQGTATNADGAYSLSVPSLQDTLVFSYIGYKTQQIPINGQQKINVQMQSQALSGDELVVVAFGEQSTETVTGSISSVSTEQITQTPTASVGNALTGKVPGLTTIQTSGAPGNNSPAMYVRGISSLSSDRAQPLFILDGVKVKVDAIMNLTPENIESVSVLKDASSLAVYGIEGANGAIVVKTKRGTPGDMNISFNANVGVQVPFNTPDIANSYDEARIYNLAQINDGVAPEDVRFPDETLEAFRTGSDPIVYPDTDWIEYLTKNKALQSRVNIRFAGGSEDVQYNISAGFLKQDGIFKTFDSAYDFNPTFNRYNLRTNLDFDITPTTHLSFTGFGRVGEDRSNLSSWQNIYRASPYAGPGLVDGKLVQSGNVYVPGNTSGVLGGIYGQGYNFDVSSTYNLHIDLR